MAKARQTTDLLFINAWNEWAEGNHLEPCFAYGHDWIDALNAGLQTTRAEAAT